MIRRGEVLAADLEARITPQDRAEWTNKGSIEDWVMEGHRLARTVAYGDPGSENRQSSAQRIGGGRTW
jgi:hypothetical protein